jgi:hypothetical protein
MSPGWVLVAPRDLALRVIGEGTARPVTAITGDLRTAMRMVVDQTAAGILVVSWIQLYGTVELPGQPAPVPPGQRRPQRLSIPGDPQDQTNPEHRRPIIRGR